GFIEIGGRVKIEFRLVVIRLGLVHLRLGGIDLVGVFALANARKNLALGYAIAHLQDSHSAVSALPLQDVVYISSRLEGQTHLGERLNICGVPEATALVERSYGVDADRNCLMCWSAGMPATCEKRGAQQPGKNKIAPRI